MSDALPRLIAETELRAAIGVKHRNTIASMIAKGDLPPPRIIGSSRRWPSTVLDDLAAGRAPWRDAKVA